MASNTEPVEEPAGLARPLPPWSWIWKLLASIVVAVLLGMLVLNVLRGLRDLIEIVVVSLFLSFALEPAVAFLARHGMRRGFATFVILFGVFALGVLLVAAMVPVFVRQLQALVEAAPGIFDSVTQWAKRVFHLNLSPDQIQNALQSANSRLTEFASNIAGNVFGIGVALLATVFKLLAIGLFTFYIVADGPRFRRQICSLLPPKQQQRVLDTWEVAIDKTGGFLYSRLLLAVFSGVATFTALMILGVDFALPLAVWMGLVSQFIPTIGTYIAMSLPLLVAVVKDPWDALILLIFFTVYQQVENYILSPRIAARTMNLHPALAFGSAIAGASLYGVVGAFLALPAAAIVQAVFSANVQRHEVIPSDLTHQPPSAAEAHATIAPRRRFMARLRRKP
jgi:predicted PurR-regulated permease PerM